MYAIVSDRILWPHWFRLSPRVLVYTLLFCIRAVSPDNPTSFTVLVYNALSSDETTVIVYVNDCSSVETPLVNQEFDFLIYQDVSADVLKVKISGMDRVDVDQLVIYDITGKIIYKEQIRTDENTQSLDKEINSSQFSSGIYIVRLIYDDTEILKKIPIR